MKQTLLKSFFFLFISILFTNCQKENFNSEPSSSIIKSDKTIDYVTNLDVPEVINKITTFTGEGSMNKTSKIKGIKYKKAYIDINKILKVKNKEAITNYTLNITVEHAPVNEFYNLVVNKSEEGKLKSPYVIKYVVDDDALDLFLANNGDMQYFKGTQHVMSFNSFF